MFENQILDQNYFYALIYIDTLCLIIIVYLKRGLSLKKPAVIVQKIRFLMIFYGFMMNNDFFNFFNDFSHFFHKMDFFNGFFDDFFNGFFDDFL